MVNDRFRLKRSSASKLSTGGHQSVAAYWREAQWQGRLPLWTN